MTAQVPSAGTKKQFWAQLHEAWKVEEGNLGSTLVVRPARNSLLRIYLGESAVFGYSPRWCEWYPAPVMIIDEILGRVIYHVELAYRADSAAGSLIPATDLKGRKYFLVPANGEGLYVPVRHGTDPSLGIWTSQTSRIKIVYDMYRCRHPAMERIDYAAHGFELIQGRIWWPIENGPFRRSFDRIRDPYWRDIRLPSQGTGHLQLGMDQTQFSAEEGSRISVREQMRIQATSQRGILDALSDQDSSDLCEELIKMMKDGTPFESVTSVLANNQEILLRPEHRGKVFITAAAVGNLPLMKLLLESGAPIPIEQYEQAAILGAQRDKRAMNQLLCSRQMGDDARGQIIINAIKRGSTEIGAWLESGSISDQKRGEAAIAACGRCFTASGGNPWDVLHKLLDTGSISSEHRGVAVIASAERGKLEHLQILTVFQNSISSEHLGQAQIAAAKIGREDILAYLRTRGTVSHQHSAEVKRILKAQKKERVRIPWQRS